MGWLKVWSNIVEGARAEASTQPLQYVLRQPHPMSSRYVRSPLQRYPPSCLRLLRLYAIDSSARPASPPRFLSCFSNYGSNMRKLRINEAITHVRRVDEGINL